MSSSGSQHSPDPDTVLISSYLVINNIVASDNGSYSCRSDNGVTTESAIGSLSVVPSECIYK